MKTHEERQRHLIDRVLQQRIKFNGLGGSFGISPPISRPAELIIPASHFNPQYPKPGKLTTIEGAKQIDGTNKSKPLLVGDKPKAKKKKA